MWNTRLLEQTFIYEKRRRQQVEMSQQIKEEDTARQGQRQFFEVFAPVSNGLKCRAKREKRNFHSIIGGERALSNDKSINVTPRRRPFRSIRMRERRAENMRA